jgi:hypothetical protein
MDLLKKDFRFFTREALLKEALEFKQRCPLEYQKIFDDYSTCSIAFLSNAYETIPFSQVHIYITCLILLKFPQEFPNGSQVPLQYFEYFTNSFAASPHSEAFWTFYSFILTKEISNESPDMLVLWAEKLLKYKNVEDLTSSIKWVTLNLISECFKTYKEYLIERSMEKRIKSIRELKVLVELDEENISLLNNFSRTILRDIEIELEGQSWILMRNQVVQIVNIFNDVKQKLDELNNKMFENIKDKLRVYLKHQKKIKVQYTNEYFNNENIDPQQLYYVEAFDIYQKKVHYKYDVKVYRAWYIDKYIIVKKYYNFDPNYDPNRTEIMTEININIYLSNRSKNQRMILKLLSFSISNDTIIIYMQDGGKNLMKYLAELKQKHKLVPPHLYKCWIIDLIETFAWLSNNRIYHCDIKPHNIVIDEEFQLRIIDFSISQMSDHVENTFSDTEIIPIQGTEGYLAPELEDAHNSGLSSVKCKPGKADVFSLGLTILQIITLDKFTGFNRSEMNQALMNKVIGLDCEDWVKGLIFGMLKKDRKERFSFNKCSSFINLETIQK